MSIFKLPKFADPLHAIKEKCGTLEAGCPKGRLIVFDHLFECRECRLHLVNALKVIRELPLLDDAFEKVFSGQNMEDAVFEFIKSQRDKAGIEVVVPVIIEAFNKQSITQTEGK